MMARLTGRERTLHATRRAPAHTPDLIGYTKPRDTIWQAKTRPSPLTVRSQHGPDLPYRTPKTRPRAPQHHQRANS
jgi:hypothetical protein